jgi:acyl-CoA hydrolase
MLQTFIKTPADSETIMTEVVCPNDTNPMGMVQGGKLVQWMDIAAAICAQRHSGQIAVTSSISGMRFFSSARVGDVITVKARITRSFSTSMEISVRAWGKSLHEKEPVLVNAAYFTFVAIDAHGVPVSVPPLAPQDATEKQEFENALKRREASLKN